MIIYGARTCTSSAGSGEFHCPRCGPRRQFSLMVAKRYFTLYFIPLFPIGSAGEYLECLSCRGTFGPEAMHYSSPEESGHVTLEEVKRMLVLAAIAEGRPTRARADAVSQQFQLAGGFALSESQIEAEANMALSARASVGGYAAIKALEWDGDFKAALFVACIAVILADGQQTPVQDQICHELGLALGYTPQQVLGLLRRRPRVH